MSEQRIKRALISVYDKTGVVEFAQGLTELGVEIISTGGTAKLLKENNVPVTMVEELTDFGEMLDGRVKTLHPKIHAAILADRDNPEHMRQLKEQGIKPIDMVVVNLYPFAKTVADPDCTFEQAVEMIDIGGPCLLRAAAKNHKNVWVLSEPRLYDEFLAMKREKNQNIRFTPDEECDSRRTFAELAFRTTSTHDEAIQAYFLGFRVDATKQSFSRSLGIPPVWAELLRLAEELRYGENPHQYGALCRVGGGPGKGRVSDSRFIPTEREQSDLSFNNYVDASAAMELCSELSRAYARDTQPAAASCCVYIKHTNACGVGLAKDPTEAYRRAYVGDPHAAMGGVLGVNFNVDALFAEAVMDSLQRWGKAAGAGAFFVEVWLAPSFGDAAVEIIRTRKKWGQRVRLLSVGDISEPPDPDEMDLEKIAGGLLMQRPDLLGLNEEEWKGVTQRHPTKQELHDLRFAWLVCKHTKSNAISICRDGMLLGNGAGQMSRVMSCRIATWLANENGHAEQMQGSAAASDGFFPFRDGPDLLIKAGVKAIIQPGGSKRDEETITACNENDVAMVLTGTRHFKH